PNNRTVPDVGSRAWDIADDRGGASGARPNGLHAGYGVRRAEPLRADAVGPHGGARNPSPDPSRHAPRRADPLARGGGKGRAAPSGRASGPNGAGRAGRDRSRRNDRADGRRRQGLSRLGASPRAALGPTRERRGELS